MKRRGFFALIAGVGVAAATGKALAIVEPIMEVEAAPAVVQHFDTPFVFESGVLRVNAAVIRNAAGSASFNLRDGTFRIAS